MKMKHLNLEIADELEKAERARLAGNEGRARVCARRAAGLIARDFLARHKLQLRNTNVYAALQALVEFPGLAPDLREAAIHLTARVDEAFNLPVNVDLIADARKLIGELN